MRATSLLAGATAVLALGTVRAEDSSHSSHDTHDHDSHGHEEHLFEQSFLYDMTNGTQNLITMPGGEETTFEGDSLAFMVVAATSSDEEGLEGAVEAAESGAVVEVGIYISDLVGDALDCLSCVYSIL